MRLSWPALTPILLLTLVVTGATARADTIDTTIGAGIGTVVPAVPIHTSITSVVYGDPVRVQRPGATYWEVLGTVHGTGWGGVWTDLTLGGPQPLEDARTDYQYAVPFVLRWPAAWDGTLVYFAHGFFDLGLVAFADFFLGPANETRYAETVAPWLSDAVLRPPSSHAYFAANLLGLGRDGAFSIIATTGPHAGDPLSGALDVPITRDLAQVAKRLLLKLSGQPVRRTIGSGHSGGALIMQFIDSGNTVSPVAAPVQVRTGGNFVEAYEPSSGLIVDGIIVLAGGNFRPDATYPLTAPIMLVSGGADGSAIDSMLYAGRLAVPFGVDLDAMVRVYQVHTLPHNFAEVVGETPNLNGLIGDLFGDTFQAGGDRLRPVVAALVDRMNDWLARGIRPPRSRINGVAVDLTADGEADVVRLPQAGGGFTTLFPLGFDPALDTFVGDQFDTSTPPVPIRYQIVGGALDPGPALALPSVACRLGSYTLGGPFADARLTPFADMAGHWPSDGLYRACVERTITNLAREGLYDLRFRGDVLGADTPRPSRPAP
jgi:hypothetical protein